MSARTTILSLLRLVLAVLLPLPLAAQVTLDLPGEVGTYRTWYGETVETTLASLSRELGAFQGRAVRVRGQLEPLDGTSLRLREGGHAVLLLPVPELRIPELTSLVGLRVEVVGVARRLPERQAQVPCNNVESAPESWCEDPELPPLPDRDGHPSWPRNSITFWGIVDATPGASRAEKGDRSTLQALASEPSRFEGEDVTVLGQFRGANLFGDLPASPRVDDDQWVIADGDAAVWVIGKAPRGKGWRLSLDDESDARWWIEIRGRVEIRGGLAYLKAKELELRPAPR